MKILFTDSQIIDQGDINWAPLERSGVLINHKNLTREEAFEEFADAEAIFIDGFQMDRDLIEAAPVLKFIGAAATGYNNIDIGFAKERGIAVCNVPAYSTEAVAQHTVALMLTLADHIGGFDREVRNDRWNDRVGAAYEMFPIMLLAGKSLGIIGYGNIGKKVGEIAEALGMTLNIYSRDAEAAIRSDVISLHCPLTEENRKMIDEDLISRMKDGVILINTARGRLVDSRAVAEALGSGKIAAYGTDVMDPEPPDRNDPLLKAPNCIITPHVAFTPIEIRQRVVDVCGENLQAYIEGRKHNRVV